MVSRDDQLVEINVSNRRGLAPEACIDLKGCHAADQQVVADAAIPAVAGGHRGLVCTKAAQHVRRKRRKELVVRCDASEHGILNGRSLDHGEARILLHPDEVLVLRLCVPSATARSRLGLERVPVCAIVQAGWWADTASLASAGPQQLLALRGRVMLRLRFDDGVGVGVQRLEDVATDRRRRDVEASPGSDDADGGGERTLEARCRDAIASTHHLVVYRRGCGRRDPGGTRERPIGGRRSVDARPRQRRLEGG